jgi:plasmid stabilization system protein ParE
MKSYDVKLSAQAELDIDRAKAREAKRDTSWPEMIDDLLEAEGERLSKLPRIGHQLEIDGEWQDTLRSWEVGDTGYSLRYRIEDAKERIIVLRFRHQARRPLKR